MAEWLHGIVQGHGAWVVGVVIFLESMGLPMPGETALVAAGIYAATMGGLAIEYVVLFAAIGAIMGDNCGYAIGKAAGRRALERWGWRIGLTPERIMLGEYLFDRHGPKVVFFGRFTMLLRTLAALLAGATRMSWLRFLFWNALGGLCWTSSVGFGAYVLGQQIEAYLGPVALLLGAVAVVTIAWSVLFVRRHEARLMQDARAAAREKQARLVAAAATGN